jgi:hypothetical protein
MLTLIKQWNLFSNHTYEPAQGAGKRRAFHFLRLRRFVLLLFTLFVSPVR